MRRFFLSHLIYIPIDYLRQLTNTLFPWQKMISCVTKTLVLN